MCSSHRYQLATNGSTAPIRQQKCGQCPARFRPTRAGQRFCSVDCRKAADLARRRKPASVLEPFTISTVMRRDRRRCVECREAIDVTLPVDDPRGPALAHVLPIAAGGRHELGNCRAAHVGCVPVFEGRAVAS